MNLHPCPLCGESKGYSVWFNERLACKACDRAVAYVGRWRTNDDAAWNAAAAHAQGLRERIAELEHTVANLEGVLSGVAKIDAGIAELEAQRVPLTHGQMLACVRSVGLPAPMGLTRDVGPYEVTQPTYFLELLIRAVERAHGIEEVKN